MADNIIYSGSGASPPANIKQATDESAVDGHMPIVKLGVSADGDASRIPADSNGLLVQQVTAPLPTGAATETTLAAVLAKLIAAPATEAKQDTLIAKDFATQTTLAAILAKLIAAPATEATAAAILAKIIAAPATEAKQDTLIAKDFATQTTLALIKTDVDKIPSQGQALAAASMPVVLPAAQITALTPPAAITGFATETTLAAANVLLGAVTETAPTTDIASSGLNGRLQRIAQRLSSLITLLPTALSNGFFQVSLKETISVPGTVVDGGNVVLGSTTGAAVITDANGTVQQYLRGIVKLLATSGTIILGAGSALIGKVGIDQTAPGTTDRVTVGGLTNVVSTPTLTVAGAYVTGDYIGPSTTPASFTSVVRTSGGAGVLESIVITDKVTTAAVALELWLFNQTFTAPTDNAAWSISDADAANCIGVIPLSAANWYASSLNKVFTLPAIALPFNVAVTTLFYALVARGSTPTWVNGDLQLTVGIIQN